MRLNKLVASDQKMKCVTAKASRKDLDASTLISMKAVGSLISLNADIAV